MGEVNRRRHERIFLVDLAFGAGEAEHHALVAGALFFAGFFLLGIDAHGNIGRLAMQQHLDVGAVIGKAFLVVTDVFHHIACDLGDCFTVDHRFAANFAEKLTAAFAGDNDFVRRAQRLAAEPGIHEALVGDAGFDIALDESIKNGIGNLVTDLVGMSL